MQKQLLKSKNYGLFKFYEHNRDVKPSQELRNSMIRNGWLQQRPALVTQVGKDLMVIDGQNRITIAKELKIEIIYEITDADDSIMADLQTGTGWKPKDYLKHYYVKGKPGYAIMKAILEKYPRVKPTVIINLLTGYAGQHEGGSKATEAFKLGKLRVTNETKTREMLELIADLAVKQQVSWVFTRAFVLAFSRIYLTGKYDHKRFLGKLEYLSEKFHKLMSPDAYFDMIKEIYNFKSKKENLEEFKPPKK